MTELASPPAPEGAIEPEPATSSDLDSLRSLYHGGGWEPGSPSWEHLEERIARGEVAILRGSGRIVASVAVIWEDPEYWGAQGRDVTAGYIHALVRDRERTAPGTGARLLTWAEAVIAGRGRGLARLDTRQISTRLVQYYEEHRYRPVATRTYPWTTSPVVLFEKRLGRWTGPSVTETFVSLPGPRPSGRRAALAALDAQVEKYLEASLAPSTRDKYRRALEQFQGWCALHQLDPLPASPQTVARYLAHLAQTRRRLKDREVSLSPSWIHLQLAAIRLAHEAIGLRPAPTQELAVRLVMRGIRRTLGVAPRSEASPLSVSQLREMIAATPELTIRDVRDHCVLLLGFAGALRRSEISALDWEDVSEVESGLVLRIRRSKTDPEAKGQEVGIPKGTHQETDPLIALQRWRTLSGHATGPLFRLIDRRDRVLAERMSDRTVSRILRRAARHAKLEIPDLSGHSLRAGFATSAAQAGATERAIAQQTRHRSLTTLRRYIRRGTLFEENAAALLGL